MEQFSYSPEAKDVKELAENGGYSVENFLFISTEVIAFGNKFHPTDL